MRVINLLDPFAVDQDLLKTAPKFSYQWTCGENFAHMPSMEGFGLSNQLTLHCAPLTWPALLQWRLTDGAAPPGGTKHFHGHSPKFQGVRIFKQDLHSVLLENFFCWCLSDYSLGSARDVNGRVSWHRKETISYNACLSKRVCLMRHADF